MQLANLTSGHPLVHFVAFLSKRARKRGLDVNPFNVYGSPLRGPRLKSVVVVGRPGAYGWSRRLRRGANCIVARWEGGDQISDGELRLYLDDFVKEGRITGAQRVEFYDAIVRLDEGKGMSSDLRSISRFGKLLSIRVIVRTSEPPRPEMKLVPRGLTYGQAYRLASFIRKDALRGVEVRVVNANRANQGSSTSSWWKMSPGEYSVRVCPSVT
jgi:hypothetical protein